MWRLLLISFALVTGSFVIDQTIRWSDPWAGFLNGLDHVGFIGSGLCLDVLPWSLIIWGIYHWLGWKRFRSHWVLAPAVFQALLTLSELFLSPPTAHGSFKQFAKAEMPVNAKIVKYHLLGGGFTKYSITYYLECSYDSLDKLITEMRLEAGPVLATEDLQWLPRIRRLPGCPDYNQWVGGRVYTREKGKWTFMVIADASKTKAYVWIKGI